MITRRPVGGVICADEFGPLNLQPRPGRAWRPAAHPARLRATYQRTGGVRHMIAALDLATGTMTYRIRERKRWREFLALLKLLHARWPGQKPAWCVRAGRTCRPCWCCRACRPRLPGRRPRLAIDGNLSELPWEPAGDARTLTAALVREWPGSAPTKLLSIGLTVVVSSH
jgi:hypothetical protein